MTGRPVDVTALPLEEAEATLCAQGWQVCVCCTAAPGSAASEAGRRVVRQRVTGAGQVEIIVASAPQSPAPDPDAS